MVSYALSLLHIRDKEGGEFNEEGGSVACLGVSLKVAPSRPGRPSPTRSGQPCFQKHSQPGRPGQLETKPRARCSHTVGAAIPVETHSHGSGDSTRPGVGEGTKHTVCPLQGESVARLQDSRVRRDLHG